MDSTEPTFPICDLFHDRFVSCLRPTRQATHIYKHSVAENCGIFVDDWRLCMKAKLEKDDDKIKVCYSLIVKAVVSLMIPVIPHHNPRFLVYTYLICSRLCTRKLIITKTRWKSVTIYSSIRRHRGGGLSSIYSVQLSE